MVSRHKVVLDDWYSRGGIWRDCSSARSACRLGLPYIHK